MGLFVGELSKFLSRPHRAFLLLVMIIMATSANIAATRESEMALKIFEATLEASKWVLGIIGTTGVLKGGLSIVAPGKQPK